MTCFNFQHFGILIMCHACESCVGDKESNMPAWINLLQDTGFARAKPLFLLKRSIKSEKARAANGIRTASMGRRYRINAHVSRCTPAYTTENKITSPTGDASRCIREIRFPEPLLLIAAIKP